MCGRVKFQVEGDFQHFYLCHCQRCRKDSGSAHAATLFSSSAQLNWQQGADSITTYTVPGTQHQKSFCQHCGSPLPNLQMDGALVVVPAGSLDTELSLTPTAHIFTADKPAWSCALEMLPAFDASPKPV